MRIPYKKVKSSTSSIFWVLTKENFRTSPHLYFYFLVINVFKLVLYPYNLHWELLIEVLHKTLWNSYMLILLYSTISLLNYCMRSILVKVVQYTYYLLGHFIKMFYRLTMFSNHIYYAFSLILCTFKVLTAYFMMLSR